MTDDFFLAVRTCNRIKQYGWPQGRGYLREPRALVSMVELFDQELVNYREYHREKK